ncbi:MAG: sensor histidine kinase [Thiohalocapsa sp.]
MTRPPDSLFDRVGERRQAPPAGERARSGAAPSPGFVAVAIALALAAVAAPAAVTTVAAAGMPGLTPLMAGVLVALLVLAPTATGLVASLAGIRDAAAPLAASRNEAEMAVLRVFVDTLLFGDALAIAAPGCIALAALALVIAWAFLLGVIRWPAAPALRRHAALALDALLLSGFLHLGGGAVAGWYPVYLLMMFYAGLRLGFEALIVSASAGVAGFAAVITSSEPWRQQPALAGGLLVALIALPACLARTLRALSAARATASGAEAQRQTTLRLIAETLRAPKAQRPGAEQPPLDHILDFAAIEAGTYVPPIESFDLRSLVRSALMPLREKAAERGATLDWRIDPRLPDRLRGHAQALARITAGLAEQALAQALVPALGSAGGGVRIRVEGASSEPQRLQLTLRLDCPAAARDSSAGDAGSLTLRLVERLVRMMNGALAVERLAAHRLRLTASLPLAVEPGLGRRAVDLGRRQVLIATADDELARELAEALAVWNAQPEWPGDIETALAGLAGRQDATRPLLPRPLLIVDGREKLLSALSLAHHAGERGADRPFVLLIAAPAQIDSLGELEEDGLDGFVPAPVSEALLANALDALPLEAGARTPTAMGPLIGKRSAAAEFPAASRTPAAAERITPIAAHPRFVGEAAAVDTRAIEGLQALGGTAFLGELIETFRTDARAVLQRLEAAAATGDGVAFDRGVVALQRAAAQLGGGQLCALLASLQGLPASELRLRGEAHVRRLDAELSRLAAALAEFLPADDARRV